MVSDENIVILPADKGNAMVVLNKSDYADKIKILLEDITYNPITDLTKCTNQMFL